MIETSIETEGMFPVSEIEVDTVKISVRRVI